MSNKSPLFVSTLELLAHATELYADGKPQKYKFVILHLANAIELILKDCLVDNSVSIYDRKNPYYNNTINTHDAFKEIKNLGIFIEEQPALELLINERNNIQHRFGFPTALSVFYYIEYVISFLKRFFEEQYDTQLAKELEPYLSKENIALLGLIEGDYSHYRKHLEVSPQAAIRQASSEIEEKMRDFKMPSFKNHSIWAAPTGIVFGEANTYLKKLIEHKYLSDDIRDKFYKVAVARNQITNSLTSESKNVDWQSAINAAIEILTELDKAKKRNAIASIRDTDNEDSDKSN